MSQASENQHIDYNDEIDLVELIVNLWREKWWVASSIILALILGVAYAFTATPIYKVSAQLIPPSPVDLSSINQTEHFSISPEEAFSELVETLESISHIKTLSEIESNLIEGALGLSVDENIYNKLSEGSIRNITYPKTNKASNSIEPNKYFFSYSGTNRNEIIALLQADLNLATTTTLQEISSRLKNTLSVKIEQISRDQLLQQKVLEDKLEARKSFVIASRKNHLKQLEEALKIAQKLNLKTPSSLTRLASSGTARQVEINADLSNKQDPLYLRGTNLLSAEIENLKNLDDNVFLDNQILELENQLLLIKKNRDLEQIRETLLNLGITKEQDVNFYSPSINAPIEPIKPKKIVIILISSLLGGIFGLLIAIGRIIYRNSQKP